ncbi:hypothetical protein BCR37DRAFT_389791 [Protomyces lactucae-debilis]|uniref:Uncharacterized protein n=1 Tax=Protomyces lactucae-debilis TaxID=2754530 RepID=A0A1Y2ETD5_PROLT|nr:uncharacterized protein BCR37DRAFT_389791 [Protomyces lactucae-debilis]ORY74823.1 hypothetical protein BCR37DRAFT_389791 [Protomyces lactucae-debilis]
MFARLQHWPLLILAWISVVRAPEVNLPPEHVPEVDVLANIQHPFQHPEDIIPQIRVWFPQLPRLPQVPQVPDPQQVVNNFVAEQLAPLVPVGVYGHLLAIWNLQRNPAHWIVARAGGLNIGPFKYLFPGFPPVGIVDQLKMAAWMNVIPYDTEIFRNRYTDKLTNMSLCEKYDFELQFIEMIPDPKHVKDGAQNSTQDTAQDEAKKGTHDDYYDYDYDSFEDDGRADVCKPVCSDHIRRHQYHVRTLQDPCFVANIYADWDVLYWGASVELENMARVMPNTLQCICTTKMTINRVYREPPRPSSFSGFPDGQNPCSKESILRRLSYARWTATDITNSHIYRGRISRRI